MLCGSALSLLVSSEVKAGLAENLYLTHETGGTEEGGEREGDCEHEESERTKTMEW